MKNTEVEIWSYRSVERDYFSAKYPERIVNINGHVVDGISICINYYGAYCYVEKPAKLPTNVTTFRDCNTVFKNIDLLKIEQDVPYQKTKNLIDSYANDYKFLGRTYAIVARKVKVYNAENDLRNYNISDILEEEVLGFTNGKHVTKNLHFLLRSKHKEVSNELFNFCQKLGESGAKIMKTVHNPTINGWVIHRVPLSELYLSKHITIKAERTSEMRRIYNYDLLKRELLKLEL